MKFSTRSTYGLRAMIRLARNYDNGTLALSAISNAEHISLGYLERLFRELKKARLVDSVKGASGGYRLSQSPEKTNIFEIVKILEGNLNAFYCLDENGKIYCDEKFHCDVAPVLSQVQQAVVGTLKSITLGDLIREKTHA